jgi:hypothetical protein
LLPEILDLLGKRRASRPRAESKRLVIEAARRQLEEEQSSPEADAKGGPARLWGRSGRSFQRSLLWAAGAAASLLLVIGVWRFSEAMRPNRGDRTVASPTPTPRRAETGADTVSPAGVWVAEATGSALAVVRERLIRLQSDAGAATGEAARAPTGEDDRGQMPDAGERLRRIHQRLYWLHGDGAQSNAGANGAWI